MNAYEQLMELFWADTESTMALFTAYIDNQPGFEVFCSEIPLEWFTYLKSELQKSDDLREAMMESRVFGCGVSSFLEKAVESYDMWCRLLDGTEMILNDPMMRETLFSDDLGFIEKMYSLWSKGMFSEENWNVSVEEWGKESVLSGVGY